jgi:hypothetical protein
MTSRTRVDGRWTRAGARLAAALLCGAGIGAVLAAEAQAPEPLETELIRARNMIINATSKLRNDVLGVAPGEGSAPATIARSCCSTNLEQIEEAIRESARILKDFDRCYEARGDTDMVLRARVALSDLSTFGQSLPAFANARGKREAQGALQEISRNYNVLRENAVGLDGCGDVAVRAAPSSPTPSTSGAASDAKPAKNPPKKKKQQDGSK